MSGPLRDGYVLLAVLWICVGVAGIGVALSGAARAAVTTSGNRIRLTRAEWRADGCVARARAVLATELSRPGAREVGVASSTWTQADRVLRESVSLTSHGCALHAEPVGARLDVNHADEWLLTAVAGAVGYAPALADSAAAAILDWIDGDGDSRPAGAEKSWYEARARTGPANRPIRSVSELRQVRGVDTRLERVLGVEEGPLSLNHAPARVLAVLPGLTPEAVERVLRRRESDPLLRLAEIGEGLSEPARIELARSLPQLAPILAAQPIAWILTVPGTADGDAGPAPTVEVRIERAGPSVRVTRRRSWIR